MIIGAMLLALSTQGAPPLFEFRQLTTQLTKEQASSGGQLLRIAGAPHCFDVQMSGKTVDVCTLSPRVIDAGVSGRPISGGQAGFDSAGLVLFRLEIDGVDAAQVASAMTLKFGDPCRSEIAEWRNPLGAVFENPTWTWCLADGELFVETRSSEDPNMGEVGFVATRLAEPAQPSVDF